MESWQLSAEALLALAAAALGAYFLRAASGIGSALILVPLGAIAVGTLDAIVLSAFLDLISGAIILGLDRRSPVEANWRVLALAMAVGVVAGSLGLRSIPVSYLGKVLGVITVAAAAWFLAGRPGTRVQEQPRGDRPRPWAGMAVCLVAGILGGVSGISGPPLAIYFGSRMAKGTFRSVVTRLFMVEAVLRVVLYLAIGLVGWQMVWLLAVSVPAMVLGTFVGNRVFLKLNERWFGALIGLVLLAAGLSLIL